MISTPAAISPAVFNLQSPSKQADTISVRYLCSESVLISWRKVLTDAAFIPVRSRLMKAVFFFRLESSDSEIE